MLFRDLTKSLSTSNNGLGRAFDLVSLKLEDSLMNRRASIRAVIFALVLIVPSLGSIQHSPLGNTGVVVYSLVAFPLLVIAYLLLPLFLPSRISNRGARMLGWGLVLTLCLATMVALPLVNRGIPPGKNVRVATVTLAVSELLQARYPYHVAVSEREPVTLLPGSLFLAVPFVWLHIAGLQSLVWIVFFYFALRKWSGMLTVYPFFFSLSFSVLR